MLKKRASHERRSEGDKSAREMDQDGLAAGLGCAKARPDNFVADDCG
jgi:hypothetical protein